VAAGVREVVTATRSGPSGDEGAQRGPATSVLGDSRG
jgi:hypothetical protein